MSTDTKPRQPKGIPVGGQFREITHPEAGVTLNADRNRALMARRLEQLKSIGFVPATTMDAVASPMTTEHREEWWNRNFVAAEYAESAKSISQMPDDYTPQRTLGQAMSGHRRTHRMRYGNGDIQLRMPSATAIKRYSKEHGNPTFDVPVSVALKGGAARQGWVRVTMTGPNSWETTALGGPDDDASAQVSEAVAAVLESRRPMTALAKVGDLLEARKARRAAEGVELTPVASSFLDKVGYDPATGTMATQIGSKLYGHRVAPEVFERLKASPRPGAVYNRSVKQSPGAGVERCEQCGRFTAAALAHKCPTGHKPGTGIDHDYTERAKQRAEYVAAARSGNLTALAQHAATSDVPARASTQAPETRGLKKPPARRVEPREEPLPDYSKLRGVRKRVVQLATLNAGDRVMIDGEEMFVQGRVPRTFGQDGDTSKVTVGFGEGKFNRQLTAAALMAKEIDLKIPEHQATPAPRQQAARPAHLAQPIMSAEAYQSELSALKVASQDKGFDLIANGVERVCEVSCSTRTYTARIAVEPDGSYQRFINGEPVQEFPGANVSALRMEHWTAGQALAMARITDAERRRRTRLVPASV
ncbi:KTSC domain-containing protein [Arthrobacter sp. A2-55]|uniref:KTSC domain-containing protein n=1 Tax=Arthrobacter sp. A2-55 TaxID=2897337 RepID=UPI0021CDC7C9|nr:KTSC domain-containing protein [Arthrobacter sp. A2-55]MCU6480549.1 KTSC domain-containing protein [Arthrobacter sp. A2-55]